MLDEDDEVVLIACGGVYWVVPSIVRGGSYCSKVVSGPSISKLSVTLLTNWSTYLGKMMS